MVCDEPDPIKPDPRGTDAATWEHDRDLCGLGYLTACPRCRVHRYPAEHAQATAKAERIAACRAKIVGRHCDETGEEPEIVVLALASILADGLEALHGG